MSPTDDRRWWPFAVDEHLKQQSTEIRVKVQFLTKATGCGCKAFVQNNESECGAIGADGRECLLVRRGKQGAEVILWQDDVTILKKLFFSRIEGEAFNAAAAVAVRWLNDGEVELEADQQA